MIIESGDGFQVLQRSTCDLGSPLQFSEACTGRHTGLGLPCWSGIELTWRVSSTALSPFPWCNVQRRNTYLAFCVPCQACDQPCRPADRDTWRLRLQPPPKEEPRHGRYLCLDPFLTVCTNGSPALSSREASQYSSALQGKSPYFRNVSPSQALGTFLLPRPSQPTARPQSDCNSEKAEALLLQSQTDTTEALSRRHTPPCSFSVLPLLDGYF